MELAYIILIPIFIIDNWKGMNSVKYISDVIGEEYKDWKPMQMIFIKSPTGTGKTTFILCSLLEYAFLTRKRIIYMVNRVILKEQLFNEFNKIRDKMLETKGYDISEMFKLVTYQEIEMYYKRKPDEYCLKRNYDYIIADECHYFMMDSIFNTNTQISYDWIEGQRVNYESMVVYMSATIEN